MSGDLPADAGLAGLAGGSAVSTSCLDFLLIELVPMAYRISAELAAREDAWTRPTSATPAGAAITAADNAPGSTVGGGALSTVAGTAGGGTAGGQGGTASAGMDEEEAREAVFYRLETLGYRVGLGVVEKYVLALMLPSRLLSDDSFTVAPRQWRQHPSSHPTPLRVYIKSDLRRPGSRATNRAQPTHSTR